MRPYYFILLALCLVACHPHIEEGGRLSFSQDTVCFDTVFTAQSSPTKIFKVYNTTSSPLTIKSVYLRDGKYFKVNVDGEVNLSYLRNTTLAAGDSLFVFVKTLVEKQYENQPVAVEDMLYFELEEHCDSVCLQASGQDVTVLRKAVFQQDTHLTGEKPYLVYDYIAVGEGVTLTLDAGCTFYMHNQAQVVVYGNLVANGTLEQPILFRGDRLDDIYEDVPYDYVSGRWDGIYLLQAAQAEGAKSTHSLTNVVIKSATNAIYAASNDKNNLLELTLTNSVLHNASRYGLVMINTHAKVANSRISNAGAYCVYLQGGQYEFVHNTIASFYGNTELNVMTEDAQDVAAVYINNLSKNYALTSCLFANNIIDGRRKNNLVLATPLPQYFEGLFTHNFIRCDTTNISEYGGLFEHNHFANENDTVIFIDDRYDYETRTYFDFHLDSLSSARGLADEQYTQPYPLDLEGLTRPETNISAGCYQ